MLCYRCGSHVPDGSSQCSTCGQPFTPGAVRQTTGTFSRRRPSSSIVEGAPYKAGDVVAGRYAIRDVLGQGPVGFVFRAHDKEVDVEVALKVVSPKLLQTPEERRAFAQELKSARKLNHANIARIYEDGEDGDRPYFTMQFLDGLSLRKIIDLRKEKGQFFKLDEIEPILAQIAAALDDAHKAGVVHGDIKPENVLVLPDLLKVTDFGLGLALPRQPFVAAQKTRRADRYAAPEFVQGGEVSSAVDVYSLGAILGEMLAGVLPEGAEIPSLGAANPAVTPQLEALYRRAVNENPQARFARAGALTGELALLLPSESDFDGFDGSATVPLSRAAVEQAISAANAKAAAAAASAPPASSTSPTRPETSPARPPSRRMEPPPPPVALMSASSSGELELTPALTRPPPIAAAGLPPPMPSRNTRPPPPTVPEVPLASPPELPSILEAPHEEPTQLVDGVTGIFPPPPLPPRPAPPIFAAIARPLAAKRPAWLMPAALTVVGLLAGIGGGWLYLQHENAEGERQLADLKKREADRRRAADVEDAGRWARLLGTEIPDGGGSGVVPARAAGPCPEGMAYLPAGDFLRGYREGDELAGWDELPLGKSHTEGYCIDLYEFPNAAGSKPRVNIAYADARTSCAEQHKRLCSEEEWERACKGPENARFTYGESYDSEACNMAKSLASSGAYPRCRSGYGVFDLSGNVAEWTSSRYTAGAGGKAVKGAPGDTNARCAGRRMVEEKSKGPMLGFRCCRDANTP